MKDVYDIAVVHGDGIGPEVCAAAVEVVSAAFGSDNPLRFATVAAPAADKLIFRDKMNIYGNIFFCNFLYHRITLFFRKILNT